MMASAATAIDFHFNVDHNIAHACRVVRKACKAGKTVLLCSRDARRRARIDLALWTFSALDFLPHVLLPSAQAACTPVWVAATLAPESAAGAAVAAGRVRDLLVLLDEEPPESFETGFSGFERVIEIVSTDENDRTCARARFQAYRKAGFAPSAHEIGAA